MNYWHMQLEPGDNKLGFQKVKDILEQNIIGMGIWDEKSNQQVDFQNKMVIGDVVLIKSGATVIGLVKVTSNYFENDNNEFWFSRRRGVEILEILDEPKKDFPQPMGTLNIANNQNTDTYQYIDKWYKNVYKNKKLSITDIKQLQKTFMEMKSDKKKLFYAINSILKSDIRQLSYIYEATYAKIEEKPVVYLRKKIIDHLKSNDIDEAFMEILKKEIDKKFPKDVFRSWGDPFRVLYSIYFAKYKSDLESYFQKFIVLIQKKLKIQDITKFTLVHFDGAQNQGHDEIWFVIYNKTYKDQKHAYQLSFFINNNQFKYGLYHMDKDEVRDIKAVDQLCFNDLLQEYSRHIDVIRKDNSKEKAMVTQSIDLLKFQKQIILQGPPGTGKTRLAKMMANYMINRSMNTEIDDSIKDMVKLIQFHPSYSYEDFVRGIVAKSNDTHIVYKVENKVLALMAKDAYKEYQKEKENAKPFVLIIDEINRANLSTVLGELIYALEYRGEPVESMYSEENDGNTIILPPNLYIIGTMNTADRSIGHIDYAIRRRFTFIDVLPDESVVHEQSKFGEVLKIFDSHLSPEFKKENVMLGHSYFIADDETTLEAKLKYQVLPLLKEYLSDGILLESAREIIEGLKKD